MHLLHGKDIFYFIRAQHVLSHDLLPIINHCDNIYDTLRKILRMKKKLYLIQCSIYATY